jgi:hypothetical protein
VITIGQHEARPGRAVPAKGRGDFGGNQLDRAKDIRMRRIDRMDLERDVRDPSQSAVLFERGDDVVRRSDMAVQRLDQILELVALDAMSGGWYGPVVPDR